jgi:hypothetical protein
MPQKKTTARKRPGDVLFISGVTPDERRRLEQFADKLGRPASWVVRDAINAYMAALAPDVEAFREILDNPPITMEKAGKTPVAQRGRPSMSDKRP